MGNPKTYLQSFIIFLLFIFFISITTIVRLYTDFLWFSALGFSKIFTISIYSKVAVFVVAAAIFFVFAAANIWAAMRFHTSQISYKMAGLVLLGIAFFQGIYASSSWLMILQYLNQVQFNIKDPILAKDAAFYVFSLPFYMFVWKFLFATIVITTIITVLYYFHQILYGFFNPTVDKHTGTVIQSVNIKKELSKLKRAAMTHMALLGSTIFLLLAVRHYLALFSVMYSEKGIVVGAGYTDVFIFLPMVKVLIVLAVVVAALFLVWIFYFSKKPKLKKRHILAFIIITYLIFAVVGQSLIPGVVQALRVTPNEINLEKPFIDNNIEFTKIAYGLDKVEETDFFVNQNITTETLEKEKETMDNIRILDYRPLIQTYKQTQEIRLYYDLSGIDIDRYTINGKYTQVMLAPRELDQSQITQNAQTWVNLHMVYGHGFGIVMSPVNIVTEQGLPDYLIKDIPPTYQVEDETLKIEQPRIYYGEKDNEFIIVNTETEEFDYPKGSTNKYIKYDGKGGIQLDSFFKKLLMAIRFLDIKILLSTDMTPESKVMFTRNIQHRINKITPFLMLDDDPYIVISDGRLYWIQDAYTVTGKFPYSQKINGLNYIRNSVKIVVDAYDGSVTYYIIDEQDPLMQTYAKIFPSQFRLFKDMPLSLKKHIRYPVDLFQIQSEIFSTYHMDDTNVFYNKEDAWQIPYEVYGTGQKTIVEPYYIIIKLPGEDKEEFVLMTTFTPIKKDNMISWLAARSDNENYGKLLLYKFPKDKLIYGPLQIEAKIDQDSEISQQLTLWSQQGSRVIRGNLLVIPIDNSILYIEPLYIQAEKGQLPELKRVLVSDGTRVVMEVNLGAALEKLFGKKKPIIPEQQEETRSSDVLIQQANENYAEILRAMEQNNWTKFGENFNNLGDVLSSLSEN
ncbi:UPF0182 family protein [Candidatus Woesearchaeota archaeon]|nr:UPF0182 family protein [Candidatus Woesearchaeota archaeon]